MGPDSRTLDRLPSLPQVLLRILDAIHGDHADFQQIASIIHHDTAMTARLLGVANSSYYGRSKACQSVERALLLLGTDTVKTIVITAAIKQFFHRFNPQHRPFVKAFWRRSLVSANFAHILANLTGYPTPDEAYLCGLLMDVGQLILLNQHDGAYIEQWSAVSDDRALLASERQHFQQSHPEVGADMIASWQLGGFMADAVRYHHEPSVQILDAHHLVKIVNLASALSATSELGDEAIEQADLLFGLNEALTRELGARISDDVERLAGSLNIDIGGSGSEGADAHTALLGERLGQLSQLGHINAELWRSQTRNALEHTIRRIVFMTLGVDRCLLFSADADAKVISAYLPERRDDTNSGPDFVIPLLPDRSLVSDALLQQLPVRGSAVDADALAVIDKQLLSYCEADHLLCLPLRKSDLVVGVLVLGLLRGGEDPQITRPVLLAGLCSEIGAAIQHHHQRVRLADAGEQDGDTLQLKIREAVHEASNPLSIIRNYLELLRVKLGEQHQMQGDLDLIKQEIDRVGTILLRLREPESTEASDGEIALNKVVADIARIFETSLCATHQIVLRLELADSLPPLRTNVTHIQQILTNLLKNAVEALPPAGVIKLTTEGDVVVNGRNFAAITVADNGPGITPAILKHLFSPVTSTKGVGHSGLGLSITKKLIDEIGGSIMCKSNKSGTEFQLLIPMV